VPEPEPVGNYVPARTLKQIPPNIKSFASSDVQEGTEVDVQVRIDEQDHVIEAHVENGIRDNGLVRTVALAAAKQWIFEPAKSKGRNIPSDHTIAFQFHP